MADEKSVALVILGLVAVLAVVGLVLLFQQNATGNAAKEVLRADPRSFDFNERTAAAARNSAGDERQIGTEQNELRRPASEFTHKPDYQELV